MRERCFFTLREMQIPNRKLSTLYMNRQKDLGSPRQILDVAIATMFRTTRNSPCSFTSDFGFDVFRCGASVDVGCVWWLGHDPVEFVGCDEFSFAFVPGCEDLTRSVGEGRGEIDKEEKGGYLPQLTEHSLEFRDG